MAKPPQQPSVNKIAEPKKRLRVFGNKPFMRFAKNFGASDADLFEMCRGIPDADLGGGVYKFRLGRPGEGTSGGARTIVAMRKGERAVLMFGFEKKNFANIDTKELKSFKRLARQYLDRTAEEMDWLVKTAELVEINAPKKATGE